MVIYVIVVQLVNVSQTVGGQLAAAEALVVLATIHPRVYGKMKAVPGCNGHSLHKLSTTKEASSIHPL